MHKQGVVQINISVDTDVIIQVKVLQYRMLTHLISPQCSGHLESHAGRCSVEEPYPIVESVQWHYFSCCVMESDSANLQR